MAAPLSGGETEEFHDEKTGCPAGNAGGVRMPLCLLGNVRRCRSWKHGGIPPDAGLNGPGVLGGRSDTKRFRAAGG